MRLVNKTAIVTGASRGIGRTVAKVLAEQGASVVLAGRTRAALEEAAEEIRTRGGQATAVVCDVTVEGDVEQLVKATLEGYGRVDILVNNAGITRDGLVMRMSEEDWDAVLDTNLKSVYRCTRAVLRPMLKQRAGRIVNIASVVGLTGNAGQANYAAAKAGIVAFTKSVAREVASRGITVNAVAPGYIDTDMTRALSPEQRERILSGIPMGRMGSTEDVAYAVAFLAGEEAGYITGQTLVVDGGLVM
ncbi:MAG: 3-oxoacyl-ACP reductase FabG [Firmicutes bacterium]|jgi:3-oxoacyl-[acyl-carrier protein] reductase|nr:3-oxoacyl-ACP reductase FabG [Bacillota bacterium]